MTTWTTAHAVAIRAALEEFIPDAVALRHELHANPDLSGREGPTAQRLLLALGADGAESVSGGWLYRVGGPGPAVGLRGELDALPLTEHTELPWASGNGAMHACGHDVHMAALVAVIRALKSVGGPVPVVAVLQPREEAVPSGAADLVASQELRDQKLAAMVAVHVQPRIPGLTFSAVPGPVNASSDDLRITLKALGGHAGYPHITGDPVVTAAAIITGIQTLVARRVNPLSPSVITIGSIHAGTAPNVIPDSAVLEGTIRAFDAADRQLLRDGVRSIAESAAALGDCTVEVALSPGEPPLVNDAALATLTNAWISRSTNRTGVDLRSCGSDDFSYYSEIAPSVMVFYGVGDAQPTTPGLHHPSFAPSDDDVLGVAECLLAGYFAACELVLGAPEGSR